MSWAGPRRLGAPGVAFEDLPKIDVVVISHDHYDHLDAGTVTRLAAAHDPLFVVPLGLKAWFAESGITRVEELDWWDGHEHRGVRFVCAPAQHFSQRGLFDRDTRLWASWAVVGKSRRLYFGGDTGYFAGFKEAGRRLGPFDVAALAIGAYQPPAIMRFVHTTPEEAVQAFEDLGASVLLGIHWGTFDLAEEPLGEPPVRMVAEARRRGLPEQPRLDPQGRRDPHLVTVGRAARSSRAMGGRVLIVEDEPDIRDLLAYPPRARGLSRDPLEHRGPTPFARSAPARRTSSCST